MDYRTPPTQRKGGAGNDALANTIAGAIAFLAGPFLHQYTVDWVLRIAAKTYPPDMMALIYYAWLVFAHLLIFFGVRAPVFVGLTAITIYAGARFGF